MSGRQFHVTAVGIALAARSSMADHAEHISTFESVTGTRELTVCQPRGGRTMPSATHREHLCPSWPAGADAETAQRCLSAMRWDLDRAVNFFMENGADGMSMLPSPASHEVVELSDGDSPAAPQQQPPASAFDDEDDPELQEALAASRRAGAWVPPPGAMVPAHSNAWRWKLAPCITLDYRRRVLPLAQMEAVPLRPCRRPIPAQSM